MMYNRASLELMGSDEDEENFTIVELSNGKFLVLNHEDLAA